MPMTDLANLVVGVLGTLVAGIFILVVLKDSRHPKQAQLNSSWLPKVLGLTLLLAAGQQLLMIFSTTIVLTIMTVGLLIGLFGYVMYGRENQKHGNK